MKSKRLAGSGVAVVLVLVLMAGMAAAQAPEGTPLGTGFTYQGQLKSSEGPLPGTCDFKFALYDALTSGTQLGILTKTGIAVDEGLFTLALDYGAGLFTGDARWLEIWVRCPSGGGTYQLLTPRQPLTAAPVAQSLVVPLSAVGASTGALVSLVNNGTGDGLRVQAAGGAGVYVPSAAYSGLSVSSAGHHGVWVGEAALSGLQVDSALDDGVHVTSAGNHGVSVGSAADDGVYVSDAGADGLYVWSAGDDGVGVWAAAGDGVSVQSAGADGVHVDHAGSPSQTMPSDARNGFEVAGAESFGLYVGHADIAGVYVQSSAGNGVSVAEAGLDGVYVESATDDGVSVDEAGGDGVIVLSAGGDGLSVGSAGDVGVSVYSSNGDGVSVAWADGDGVYANTIQADHMWGFNTPDAIYSGYALASAGPSMIVAQAAGALEPGDVVDVSGLGAPFAGGDVPAPLVRRTGSGGAVAGVVFARFVAEEKVEELEHGGQMETRTTLHGRSTEGPVAPGEYLLLVVMGQAQVKASALAGSIAAGDLLAGAADGQAALLVAGGYVPGTVVGTAMEALDASQSGGLIWALVSPR